MNFKKSYLILIIGLFVVVSCSGPKHSTKEQKDDTSSLLWKISGKDLSSPSYLFGTVHIICSDKFFWTTTMQNAFDSCGQVAEEVVLSDSSTKMATRSVMLLPKGKQLQDFFSPKDYKSIIDFAKDSLGLKRSSVVLPRLTPFAVLFTLSLKLSNQQCEKTVGYDAKILGWAKKAGKKVVGLETAMDEFNALKSVSPVDSCVKEIIQLVHHPEKTKNHHQKLQSAYLKQDIEGTNQILVSAMPEKKLKILVYDRNKRWIDSIETLIHQKPTFIAVGAGHLGGKKGVINLLKKEGYTLQPIR